MIHDIQHNSARRVRRSLLVGFCIFFATISSSAQIAELIPLQPGTPITREVRGGQSEAFAIQLDSGQFLRLAVEQIGIDVALNLLDPAGAGRFDRQLHL